MTFRLIFHICSLWSFTVLPCWKHDVFPGASEGPSGWEPRHLAVLAGAAAGRGYADAADAESQELAQTLGGASIAYWVERSGTLKNTVKLFWTGCRCQNLLNHWQIGEFPFYPVPFAALVAFPWWKRCEALRDRWFDQAECSPREEERIAMRGRLAEVIRSFRESRWAETAVVSVRFLSTFTSFTSFTRVGMSRGHYRKSFPGAEAMQEWQYGS